MRSYVATYVERDVRSLHRVVDLGTFATFLRLCAGRTGQEINLAALAGDAGISVPTVKGWLSVLEASWIVTRLPAWHRNHRNSQIKSPKLHFLDSGLCCHLLGITAASHLASHPLRGAIAESWVVSEILKARLSLGVAPGLAHWREPRGPEVDVVVDRGDGLVAVEVKGGQTVHPKSLAGLARFAGEVGGSASECLLVYGGKDRQVWSRATVLGWEGICAERWA